MPKMIFVSSVQSEFAEERAAIRDFVRADALLGKHFEVFLFEDQPAQSRGRSSFTWRRWIPPTLTSCC
jgi:ATP-dependent DNA helicase RecG